MADNVGFINEMERDSPRPPLRRRPPSWADGPPHSRPQSSNKKPTAPPKTTIIGSDVVVQNSEKEEKIGKCKRASRTCCKILFSHFGLFVLVVSYTLAGGKLFETLEQPNEDVSCYIVYGKYLKLSNETTNRLYEVANLGLDEDDTKVSITLVLEKFRDDVYALDWDVNCTQIGQPGGLAYKWSFAGSVLFAVTVSTTIVNPKTIMSAETSVRELDRVEKQPPPTISSDVTVIESEKELKRKKCVGVCKKLLKFLFSHIGLFFMVCLYSVMGGFIFEHLEKTNEGSECYEKYHEYLQQENDTTNRLYEITNQGLAEDETKDSMVKILDRFRHNVVALDWDKNCSLLGQPGGISHQWSWAGSLMFSVTVISTIGYGHISPKTKWGKIVCMTYAVLGIPLLLLFLALIGDALAEIFKLIYSRVCCCGCFRKRNNDKVDSVEETPQPAWRTENSGKPQPPPKAGPLIIEEDDDDDDDEFDEDSITIPLTVTMLIIVTYVVFGALLFHTWEQWNMLDSSYFCFVTISTIGFGDFVPGTEDLESTTTHIQLIAGAIYIIFGMAIVSMCFSLIQDEIAAKFKWMGQKIGLVDKTSDDDADDG